MKTIESAVSPSADDPLDLVEALRSELQEYGGLLRVLKEEQDLILANPAVPDATLRALVLQHSAVADAVSARRRCMGLDFGVERSEDEIVSAAPAKMRGLLKALFAEVASLAARVEVYAVDNAWLRKRAVLFAAANPDREKIDPQARPAAPDCSVRTMPVR